MKPKRLAGVTVPLFSLRTERSWGLGEIEDLVDFGRWARSTGLRLIQLLPLGEIAGAETSPYSALSAFGIDPMYLSLEALEDLPPDARNGGLGDEGVRTLAWLRTQERVCYEPIRWVKNRAFDVAFERFARLELSAATERAKRFEAFCAREAWWLDDYALFRAIKDAHEQAPWWRWPAPLCDRVPTALAAARVQHAARIARYRYLQWLAHEQWARSREALDAMGVEIMGDLPFMVGRDSADVWSNRGDFRDDGSVGVPGDQFDPEGQEWGLPPYHWRVMRANGFRWLRRRASYAASLYRRFRIDHVVGFFRTYMRDVNRLRGDDGKLLPGFFDPAHEPDQKAHGEAVIGAMVASARERGAQLVAEDLGVIPDFVRPVLAAMNVPGYKVLIWEQEHGHFRDPAQYPTCSVACFATHDTAPVAVWWESLPTWEREAVCRLPVLASHGGMGLGERFGPRVHEALLDLVLGASSELVLLLMQDVLGSRDRINVPGTVDDANWTWRLPRPIDVLATEVDFVAACARVRDAIARAGR